MPEVNYFWDEIEDNVVREYDDNNTTVAQYTTEPTQYGSVLSQNRGGEVRHYQFDGQGNTTELTDESGNVTDTRRYSAFGATTASSGTTVTPLGFGGRWGYYTTNPQSLVTIRRRILDLAIGRWASPDPYEHMHPSESAYVYSVNRPVEYVDPSGLMCQAIKPCCCCPTDVKIKDIGLQDLPNGGKYYGMDVDLETAWKPSEEYRDCTLEWWEWSNIQPLGTYQGKPIPKNTWNDMYVKQRPSPQFEPWRNKKVTTDCTDADVPTPGRTVTVHDTITATLSPKFPVYTIFFAIVLRGAEECKCEPVARADYAKLVIKHKDFPKGTGLTIGPLPKPPGYPPGLPLDGGK